MVLRVNPGKQEPRPRVGARDFGQTLIVVGCSVEIAGLLIVIAQTRKRIGVVAIGAVGRRPLAHRTRVVFGEREIVAVIQARSRNLGVAGDGVAIG
jgi:hypothetical protein